MEKLVLDYIDARMVEIVAQGKHINGCCRTSLINELMDIAKLVGADEEISTPEKDPVPV